jgi:hypothetical protein
VDRSGFERLEREVLKAATILEGSMPDLVELAQFPWVAGDGPHVSVVGVNIGA